MDDRNAAAYEARWSNVRDAIADVLDGGEADLSRLLYEVGLRTNRKQTIGRKIYKSFGLRVGDASLALQRVARAFIVDTVLDYADGVDAIVELGAGWGCNLFHLWVRGGPRVPLYALEPTEAGRAGGAAIAARFPAAGVRVGAYDFLQPDLPRIEGARRVLVFTAHALDKVAEPPALVIEQIRGCAPEVTVMHFEAIEYQLNAGHGASAGEPPHAGMNCNLYPLLRAAEAREELKIDEIRPSILDGVSTLIRWSACASDQPTG